MKKHRPVTLGNSSAIRRRRQRTLWSKEKSRLARGGKRRLDKVFGKKNHVIRLRAPTGLSLGTPSEREQLCAFLSRFRAASEEPSCTVVLDFSGTDRIASSGAVLFIAELDRALALRKCRIQAHRSATPLVEEVFQQIGVYRKLGINCDVSPESESVIHWQAATGTLAEGDKGGSILESYEGRLPHGLTKGLYEGVVEAMTNTVHHAYPDTKDGQLRRRGIGKRWWMLSQELDGELTVTICDLGVGIPKSLPTSKTYESSTLREFWRNTGLDKSDGSAISVAIQIGKTRTGLDERGYGLADIVAAATEAENGRVLITSNRGIFVTKDGNENVVTHRKSINGTLVHWTFPILESASDGQHDTARNHVH